MLDKYWIPALQRKSQQRNSGLALRFLMLAGLVRILSACGGQSAADAPVQPPPPAVKIAQVLSQETMEWDEYTGRVEAVNMVDIRARVGGYLEKVNFVAGEKVKQGQLLFLIDPKPYQAQLNFANAELERAKTRHELAKNDLHRAENLYKEKAISTEEFDSRSKGLREAAAAVESATANVYTARINLDYCAIRAPISGRISRETITAGNMVNGGDTTILTTIVSLDPVYVYVDADEQSVLKYRRQAKRSKSGSSDLKGTPVQLQMADEHDYPHHGYIDYVAPREDTSTGTVSLRGVFANPDELLSPGFFARLRVQGSAAYQALLIPERAIVVDQAQRFVWISRQDNSIESRRVTLGASIGQMRVISDGLRADDWVVVEGLQKLMPGIKVNPERISLLEQTGEH